MQSNLNPKKLVLIGLGLILFLILIAVVYYVVFHTQKIVSTYEECAAAGYPILETYPPQCKAPDGKLYVKNVNSRSGYIAPKLPDGIYGDNTGANCTADSGCVIGGCNSEICMGKGEDGGVSICLAPENPTPKQTGYACSCLNAHCLWAK
jgi:hypothetical protein